VKNAFEKIKGFDERLGRGATIDISEEHHAFSSLSNATSKSPMLLKPLSFILVHH
jgi:hypothetical protein